jgi:hypothetical protein
MVRAWPCVAASSMSLLLLGCPVLKKKTADAGPGPGPDAEADAMAMVDAGTTLTVANESEVTRYPDETPIANIPATLRWSVTDARTQASRVQGAIVAALKAGTAVKKIAERQGFFLVVFADPRDARRNEEGWVAEAAFAPEPPHKRVAVKCAAGQVAVLLQMGEERCVTECANDTSCPSGESCSGAGPVAQDGAPGAMVTFCRQSKPSSGADAGPEPHADAGAPSARPLDVKPGPDGKCAAGYAKCAAICRMTCKADADCGLATARCQGGFCLGPGAQPCGR